MNSPLRSCLITLIKCLKGHISRIVLWRCSLLCSNTPIPTFLMQRHNDNFSVSKSLCCPVAIPDYIPAADWSRKKKIFRCDRISLWVSAGSGTLCVQMHVFAFCFHGMGNLRCRIPNQAWSVLFSNHGKAFVIKFLSETKCSTFIFGSQEK